MVDYKTFKKEYLTEWVDRSQAARKAAEELAKKEVRPSLRDKYKPQNVIMTLNGKQVEFKGENEKNPNDPEYNLFTYEEAMERFGKPDEDGWRLPTYEELEALCHYPFEFDEDSKQGVIDKRLSLPAAGFRTCDGEMCRTGSHGYYWSSTPTGSDGAYYLGVYLEGAVVIIDYRCYGHTVRLVRDVN